MAFAMILTVVAVIGLSVSNNKVFGAGDYAYYRITGPSIPSANAYQNFTMTDSGIGHFVGAGYTNELFGKASEAELSPTSAGIQHMGKWAYTDQLDTPFGIKYVKTYLSFGFAGDLIMTSIGYDSSVVYKIVIAGVDHQCTAVLNGTNSKAILDVDKNIRKESATGASNVTSNNPGTCLGPSDKFYSYGAVQIRASEPLNYSVSGDNISAFLFDVDDLKKTYDADSFNYNGSLSRLAGVPVEVSAMVEPGTYWFFVIAGHGEIEQCFAPYWGM